MRSSYRLLALFFACVALSCCGVRSADDTRGDADEVADLAGQKVAVISGSLQDLALSETFPEIVLLRLSSSAELIAAVASGQADYAMTDSTSIIGLDMERMGLSALFMSDIVSGYYGFGFNRQNRRLQSEFNGFLSNLRKDGLLDEITGRWTGRDVAGAVMPDLEMNPSGEVLRIGTFSYFPFSFVQNEKYAGLEVEILERFAAATGRRIKFLNIDFSGMIAALITGKVDMVACTMTITEERSRQISFSDPYFFCRTVCYGRSDGTAAAEKSFFLKIKERFHSNLILENRWKLVAGGLWETLVITVLSILIGTLFGAFICWMRLSRRKVLRRIAAIYVDIIRGIPILVLLMLMFYVVFAEGGLTARWVAVFSFALNFGAYVSEMFRTGIESIDKGQTEAGLAMGFSPVRTFVLFIIPQVATKVIPVFKGEAVSLLKNTSVVGFIAILDLTKASEIIRARTFDAFFPLIAISVIYFFLAWAIGKLLDILADRIS